MICLKNGKRGAGQQDRDRAAGEAAQRAADRRKRWGAAGAAWDSEIAATREPVADYERVPYPVAARRALRAWDAAMGQNFGGDE